MSTSDPNEAIKVLLVEDNSGDTRMIYESLKDAFPDQFNLTAMKPLAETMAGISDENIDVILVSFSGITGLETVSRLLDTALNLPIVVLSEDEKLALQALHAGAQDYLLKQNLDSHLLSRVLRAAVERHRATQEKQTSEAHFRALVQHSTDIITILAVDGTVLYESPSLETVMGYKPEAVQGLNLAAVIHPDDLPILAEGMTTLLAQQALPFLAEVRLRHADGSWRILETTMTNLLEHLAIQGIVVNSRDITERKRTEEALRDSELRYHHVLDSLLEGAEIIGFDWRYLYVNDASVTHGRQSKDILLRSTVTDLYPGIENTAMFAIFRRCMEERIAQHFETEFAFPDGTHAWFDLSVQPIPEGIFILSLEITERKQSETALRRYAQRMEILHEIDTGIINAASIQAVVEAALKRIRQIIPCQQARAILFDSTTSEGMVFAVDLDTTSGMAGGSRLPLSPRFLEEFVASPITVIDDLELLQEASPIFRQLIKDGVRSTLRALLIVEGHPVGMLALTANTPGFFTADYHEIAGEVANQLAIAVRQMRLTEEIAQHAAELEQKVSERTAELSDAKERAEAILNNSTGGILLVHPNLSIQQTNGSFNRMFGCEPDTYFGESLFTLIHAEDANLVSKTIRAVLTERHGKTIELRLLRKDGTDFEAELSIVHIKDDGLVCTIRDITERKLTEAALRTKMEDEREYHNYLNELHQITMKLTLIDHLDDFYQQVVELGRSRLGFDRLALFRYDVRDGIAVGTFGTDGHGKLSDERHLQFTPKSNDLMLRVFNGVEQFHVDENVPLYSDLETIGIGWNAAAILWDGTQSLGWLVADNLTQQKSVSKPLLDILGLYALTVGTLLAQKQVQIALQESEARYRLLAENISDLVTRIDTSGIYIYLSPSSRTVLGYDPEELVGKSGFELVHPADVAEVIRRQAAALDPTAHVSPLTYRSRHKDGHYLWLETSGQIIWSADKKEVVGYITISRDITQRKVAEEALRESEARFRQIAENIDQVLFIRSDDDQKILYISPRYEAMWGQSRESLYENPASFMEPVHPDDLDYVYQQLGAKRYAEEGLADFECRIIAPDHLIHWVRVRTFPIRNDADVILRRAGIIEDITERKQSEAELRQAWAKEKHLNELKSSFVSMVSHDFRTPLASIQSSSDLLRNYSERMTDEKKQKHFTTINGQIKHLTDLLEDTLILTKAESVGMDFHPVGTDLEIFCQALVDEMQPLAGTHPIQLVVDGPVEWVMLDPQLLRRVLVNLLSNAVKYSPEGSAIELTVARESERMMLRIQDHGIGIPEADQARLFEVFHRAKNVGGIPGTGLGLAIVKLAVEAHGGTITVDSMVGVGSTFTILLPVLGTEAETP